MFERGRHRVAAGVDLVAGIDRDLRTEDSAKLLADLPDEVGCPPLNAELWREDHRFRLGSFVLVDRVARATQGTLRLHPVEDVIPPNDDGGVGGDDELELGAVDALFDRLGADLLGLCRQGEGRRRLGDRGEDRRLGQGEVLEGFAEVRLRRGPDAVRLVAVEVLVHVRGDDLLLALLARELLGQPKRLDDLPDLPLLAAPGERAWGQETRAHELLGDRRAAARPAVDGVDRGGQEAREIEARVVPEILVLDRGRGIEDFGRQVGERHELALALTQTGQLDLPGSVRDARLLIEVELREEDLRVRQTVAVVAVGGRHPEQRRGARADEGEEQDDRDGNHGPPNGGGPAGPPSGANTSMALAPRKAGVHIWPHDSIGVVVTPLISGVETARLHGV